MRVCAHQAGEGLLSDVNTAHLFLALRSSDYKEHNLLFPEQHIPRDALC